MKLILENFRCYQSRTFDLPDQGVILLNGDSGKGKTTVLKAIHFVLYGKELKTTTFGMKKSKVEVHLDKDQIVIKRTRGPGHLSVTSPDFVAEDAAAQAWINQRFGSYFLQTSYLSQKCLDNFLTQSKENRSALLRTLCINNFDIDGLKAKNKENIKVRKANLATVNTEYKYITSELQAKAMLDVIVEEPSFPLVCKTTFEDAIKEEARQQEMNWKKLTIAQQSLKDQNKQLLELTQQQSSRAGLETQLQDIQQQVQSLKEKTSIPVMASDAPVNEQKRLLKNLQNYILLQEKQDQLLQRRQEVNTNHQTQLDALDEQISNTHYDRREMQAIEDELKYLEKCQGAYTSIKTSYTKLTSKGLVPSSKLNGMQFKTWCSQACDQSFWSLVKPTADVDMLSKQLYSKKLDLQTLQQQQKGKVLKCPDCNSSLAFVNNCVMKHNAQELEKQIQTLGSIISTVQEQYDAAFNQNKAYEQSIVLHNTFVTLLRQHEDYMEEDADELSSEIARAQKELNDQQQAKDQLLALQVQRRTLERKPKDDIVTYLEKEISELSSKVQYMELRSLNDAKEDFEQGQIHLQQLEQELLVKREQEVIYKRQVEELKALENKAANLQKQLDRAMDQEINELKTKVAVTSKEVDDRQAKAERFNKRKTLIEEWKSQYARYSEYQRLMKRKQDSLMRVQTAEQALRVSLRLATIVNDVESQAMQDLLKQLNEECEQHMEVMFDGAMSLKVIYENGGDEDTPKYFVDIQIIRNGEVVPDDSLSGGEFDRCALALFLAFNKLSKSSMLLLDECLSSLHAESVEDIVEHIKMNYSNKMCIMTLHQTTRGIFDHVIDLE